MLLLNKNQTWDIVEKAKGPSYKLVSCRWNFKKPGMDETENIRYKARLVARGFIQEEGVDYNEISFPVVKHSSIRILLSIVPSLTSYYIKWMLLLHSYMED